MMAADDPVAPHLGGVAGRQRDGDGLIVHIQADEQRGTDRRDGRRQRLLRLDSF